MTELGFIRYGEMISTNVKYLGLCLHEYLYELRFAPGHSGLRLYCIVQHVRISK